MKLSNMKNWLSEVIASEKKKAFPILTFPSVVPLGITVSELIKSSDLQAKGMEYLAKNTDSLAALGFMDLSVEAECFGANVKFSESEVPTVVGSIINDESDADNLKIPEVGSARSQVYIDAIKKAKELIKDKPVIAGMIGPFSLAARLFGVSEVMMECYDDPEAVNTVLEKVTEFLTKYALAFKNAGADGILIAEPVSGLLSPAMEEEFSSPFVKKIVDSIKDDDFAVFYHNCGNNVPKMTESIKSIGADGYHFGNNADMIDILDKMPSNVLVMGNIDPAGEFRLGTKESVYEKTYSLLEKCSSRKNFVISSGCDIPPLAPFENINAFYSAVGDFYGKN